MKTLFLTLSLSTFLFMQQQEPQKEDKWPKEEKEAFIKSCIKNAKTNMTDEDAKAYCDCMLEKVIEKYPTPEQATKLSTEEAQKMAVKCLEDAEES